MDNDKLANDIHKLKEINDIKSEYDRVEELLNNGQLDELEEYLQQLNFKYLSETATYNLTHPIPAQNVQQNAVNCMGFLRELALSKTNKRAIDDENCRH